MPRRYVRFVSLSLTLASLLAVSCSDDTSPPKRANEEDTSGPLLDQDCDPLVPSQCGYPFPSSVYLEDDPKTPTGKHVRFRTTTLPARFGMPPTDPSPWLASDGFSPGQAPLTDLQGATTIGLPTQDTIELSVTARSPTILLDAETGQLVPHFAELDASDGSSEEDRAFMIRPVLRLKDATRYIVAIRHVVDKNGNEIAPSPAFKALRDGTESDERSVRRRRTLYDDIFARLEKAGIARNDLQIAWDYLTASRDNNTKALVFMRDDALSKVGDDGPPYVIDAMEENPNPYIRRRIHGHMRVPLYLDKAGPGGKLTLGKDGLPVQNGTADYEFVVHIPNSLVKEGKAGPLLQNAHGLLGSKKEGQDDYLAVLAEEKGYVAFGVDFVGMADEDSSTITNVLGDEIGNFRALVDRQHQGVLNSLLAMRMMKGAFARDKAVIFDGKSVIDKDRSFYRGDSQGGIFGATYMALSTDVTRGLLGEPGAPYGLLLNRSSDFTPFFNGLKIFYRSAREIQLILGAVQMLWDRTEPNGYIPYITKDMLPRTPKHDVLLHVAIGDHQVTPLGAHIIARAVEAKNLKPVNRSLFGIPGAPSPITGSAIVEYSFGLPQAPKTNTPPMGPEGSDPHDKVRVLGVVNDQTDEFFRTGLIKAFCQGPCDPE